MLKQLGFKCNLEINKQNLPVPGGSNATLFSRVGLNITITDSIILSLAN